MKDCPTIAAKRSEGTKSPPSVLEGDLPRKNHFYDIRSKNSKLDDDDEDDKLQFSQLNCCRFLLCRLV